MLNIRPSDPFLFCKVGGIFAFRGKITRWAIIKIYISFMYIHNSKWIFDASTYPIKQEAFCSWLQEAENLSRQQGKGWEMQTLKNPGSFILCCSSQRFSVFQLVMGKLGCLWSTVAENLISWPSVRVGFPCSTKRHQLIRINVLQTNASFFLQHLQFRHLFWYIYILEEVPFLIWFARQIMHLLNMGKYCYICSVLLQNGYYYGCIDFRRFLH